MMVLSSCSPAVEETTFRFVLTDSGMVTFDTSVAAALEARSIDPSALQRETVRRGQLEFDEYQNAMMRAIDCGEQQGYDVEFWTDDSDGFDSIRLSIGPPLYDETNPEREMLIWDQCYDRHMGMIDTAWQLGHAELSEAAHVDRWKLFVECIEEAGGQSYPTDPFELSGEGRAAAFEESATISLEHGIDCVKRAGL